MMLIFGIAIPILVLVINLAPENGYTPTGTNMSAGATGGGVPLKPAVVGNVGKNV